MCVKAPRGLSHGRRLYRPETWTSRLVECWHELGSDADCCWSSCRPTRNVMTTGSTTSCAACRNGCGVAVELRHHSWAVDPVFDLLSRHQATYVVMSGAGLPCVLRATSTTVYVRLHGPDHDHLYAGSYGDADLYWWADRIREWHRQHLGVFAYFNNDGYGHAVTNARRLRTLTNS